MEFVNYNRKDVSAATTASTGIKNVRSITSLKLNLKSGKNETTFSGLGSYLEVDVKQKGATKKVKIPFFSAYKKDKFINVDGYAFINPLAKKIIEKVVKNNIPEFDLVAFQTDATNEINDRINALGTSPAEVLEKAKLENRRDNVIATARKKDSDKLVKEEIAYLEDVIKKGVNVRAYTNDINRKAALAKHCNQLERLIVLKSQSKKLTWSQKKGISKLNNKTLKRVGVGLAALAVAAGLVIGRVIDFPKYTWNTIKNWFNKPKATVTQTVGPLKKASITPIPKAQQTPTKVPIVTVAPTNTPIPTNTLVIQKIRRNLNTMDSEMFIVAAQANYDNFIDAKNYLTKYGYNYEDVINSYTVIEHLHQLDTTRLTSEDIHRHIANARTLVAMIVSSGAYNSLPLRSETFETMQDCLNGNPEAGARFVAICSEYNEPLLDMLAIGELESNLIFNQELYNFNVNIYYPEINEYKTRILNDSFEVTSVEPSKVKTLRIC